MYPRSERAAFDETGGVGQMVYGLKAWHAVYGVFAETLAMAPDVADRLRARNRGELWAAIYRAPVLEDVTLPAGVWEIRGKVPVASAVPVLTPAEASNPHMMRRLKAEYDRGVEQYVQAFGKAPRRPCR